MMIASPGLLKTLEKATGSNQVNKELALLVVQQVNISTLYYISIISFIIYIIIFFFCFSSYECSLH